MEKNLIRCLLYIKPRVGYLILGSFERKPIAKAGLTGTHGEYGIFVASGPDIRRGEISLKIVDVAPTVLHVMDAPIPYDVDGRIL